MSNSHDTQQFPPLVESRPQDTRDSRRGDDPVEAPTGKTVIVVDHGVLRYPLALVLIVCGLLGLAATSASAANFTWSGAAAVGEPNWSTAANWEGGTAPSGSIGTLTFPKLTTPECTAEPPTKTCITSTNDLTGLTVEAIAIDADANYGVKGNGITLGSGGITVTTSEGREGFATLFVPITLGAPQTWSVDGGGSFGDLNLGTVTGAQTLHVDLSHRARVTAPTVEVGALSIVGANAADTGAHAIENGYLEPGELNGSDGSAVNITDAELKSFFDSSYSVGPLTSTGGAIGLGSIYPGTVTVNGGVTLDSASLITVGVNKPGTVAGTDYSQLSPSGPVALGGGLEVEGLNQSGNVCPTLQPGDVDTLITTTGALSGQFAGISDGQLVPVTSLPVEGFEEVRPRCATARINYSTHDVTATIVSVTPPPTNLSSPSVTGNTWVGQTLTATAGTWMNEAEPGGYSGGFVQWEDCDVAGTNCVPIERAVEPTYTLTAADVGHTIRLQETFFNVAGSNAPVASPASGVVTSSMPAPTPVPKLEPKLEPKVEPKPTPEPPLLGQRQIAMAVSGTVSVRRKGTSSFVAFSGSTSIPDGSEVDATNGRVVITVATPSGNTVSAEVYGGRFRVHQDSSGETHFILTLPLTGCPKAALPHGAAARLAKRSSGPKSRHLWASETGGSWGTNGRYVATTVQGTTWLTLDECTRSEVKVTAGKVKVLDLVRRKTKMIAAGHSYIAAARRGRHA